MEPYSTKHKRRVENCNGSTGVHGARANSNGTYSQTKILIFTRHSPGSAHGCSCIVGLRHERQENEKQDGQQLHEHAQTRGRLVLFRCRRCWALSRRCATTRHATAARSKVHAGSKASRIKVYSTTTSTHGSPTTTGHASSKKGIENVLGRHFGSTTSATIVPSTHSACSTTTTIVGIFVSVSIVNGPFLRIRQSGIRQSDRLEGFVGVRRRVL
jgi:hypothetical protein